MRILDACHGRDMFKPVWPADRTKKKTGTIEHIEMAFSPARVVSILQAEFGQCTLPATRKEKKIAMSFSSILREALYSQLSVDEEEDLECDSDDIADPDWDANDKHSDYSANEGVLFDGIAIDPSQVCLLCSVKECKKRYFTTG